MINPLYFALAFSYVATVMLFKKKYFTFTMVPVALYGTYYSYIHQTIFHSESQFIQAEATFIGIIAISIYINFFLEKHILLIKKK